MKTRVLAVTVLISSIAIISCNSNNGSKIDENSIDLSTAKNFEILSLEEFSATPDENGDIKSYEVTFPEIERMIYYSCDERFPAVAPNNKTQTWLLDQNFKMLNAPDRSKTEVKGSYTRGAHADGTLSILKLKSGKYMIILPLVGKETMARFTYTEGQNPQLTLFSWGTKAIENMQVPLLAYCVCEDIYQGNYTLWSNVINSGLEGISGNLRKDKKFPEHFNYLGWCSWEEYKFDISEEVLTNAISEINHSEVPVRWVLVDDGTQSKIESRLTSFEPDPIKFPNGFEAITSQRSDDGIKWMGVWHYQAGYGRGINLENDMGEEFNKTTLKTLANGTYRANEDFDSQKRFLEGLLQPSIKAGFDFVKIDFQGVQFDQYRGNDNAVSAHMNTVRAQEVICKENNLELLNCMAQDLIGVLNTKYSAVVRSSQDYHKGVATGARIQTYQCFNNAFWLGHTANIDHDMFHSSDEMCNRMMSYAKSISAGPVYLSDAPEDFAAQYILPLCYDDGELLKPLATAVPLAESLFECPINTNVLYKVIAPLSNGAAAMVCYNIYDEDGVEINDTISPEDYKSASAMIQPYVGEWEIPSEGLILYDLDTELCQEFNSEYNISLTGISAKMVNICPINNGWAMIGDTTKYLAPETFENLECSSSKLSFTPKTSGEYKFWIKTGTPICNEQECKKIGEGAYSITVKKGEKTEVQLR